MSENELRVSSIQLFHRRTEIEAEELRRDSLEAPLQPTKAITYSESIQYAHQKKQYDDRVANANLRIQNLQNEVRKIEIEVRQIIPAKNVPIIISGKYDNEEYTLIVTHANHGSDDRITVERAQLVSK